MVSEQKHRLVCATKPLPACQSCAHSKFKLVFTRRDFSLKVLCPRWSSEGARCNGEKPESYQQVEVGVCKQKPFSFCPSCPSLEDLKEMYVDKTRDGWVSRWERFK